MSLLLEGEENMRYFALCTLVLIVGISAQISQAQTAGTATLNFSLSSPGGTYSPNHIDAVWVTDPAGNFIETLRKEAGWSTGSAPYGRSRYLYTWDAARGGTDGTNKTGDTYIDGVSTATATSYANPITVTWDCLSKANTLLPDGIYHMHIEFTDAHVQGPLADIPFTKGSVPVVINPADQTYIKGMQLSYVPDPGTLALLATGVLAVVRRRQR